jgi:hypothetical protein
MKEVMARQESNNDKRGNECNKRDPMREEAQ